MLHKDYHINTDKTQLDIDVIHGFLSNSYWAKAIPKSTVQRSIDHSLCFGVYFGKEQVGFARVITDYTTFAYIGDVFIVEEHRKKGLSKALMSEIKEHPELQGLRRWILMTRDAHGLYKQFDFTALGTPQNAMEIAIKNIYLKSE